MSQTMLLPMVTSDGPTMQVVQVLDSVISVL